MKYAFRIILIILIIFILCPSNVNATSGYLTHGTVKRCPNGVLYGSHAGHWHKAVKRNGRYFASGKAIKNDPCPPKSDDNDLKSLKVDGESISVYDTMYYETYNNKIKIEAKPYDSKAKVTNNYKGLKVGENIIKIVVTAQNGDKQVYTLNVNRLEMNTSIESLTIDDNSITVSEEMTYETYNKDIKINVIPTDEDVKVTTNYKSLNVGNNAINIVLTASNGDKSIYYLNVLLKEEEKEVEPVVEESELIVTEEEPEAVEDSPIEEIDKVIEEPVVEEEVKEEKNEEEKKEPPQDSDDSDDLGILGPLVLAVPAGIVIKKIKKK